MPTAVSTESSENTMSSSTIWNSTPRIVATLTSRSCGPSPSSASWISVVAFQIRNRPPTMRMMSRHENSMPAIVNTGAVSPTIHEIDSSSRIRMPIASPRPIVRARSRCSAGRRWTRTEMKTTLSIPSTISMSVRVSERDPGLGTREQFHVQRVPGTGASRAMAMATGTTITSA